VQAMLNITANSSYVYVKHCGYFLWATLFLPFCKPDQKTQLRKMLLDISEHNISYLQSLLFVDIVELQNTYHRRSNARGTTTRAEYKRRFV
jgi:surface polysaccharide O-acyltransferase-like enzyme